MRNLSADVVACPECDLLQSIPALSRGGTACCPRCGCKLAVCKPDSIDRTLALSVAAAIAFLIANLEPLMGLSVAGRESSTTIAGGAWQMWVQGETIAALLIALFAVIAPALQIGFLLAILGQDRGAREGDSRRRDLRDRRAHPAARGDVVQLRPA
ncbi:MAG: Paraquat-inducible protein [Deltaproteobacteria bacterium]|nr:Paraquat-inducible protein [Deltaproteobacteria bacterium]